MQWWVDERTEEVVDGGERRETCVGAKAQAADGGGVRHGHSKYLIKNPFVNNVLCHCIKRSDKNDGTEGGRRSGGR